MTPLEEPSWLTPASGTMTAAQADFLWASVMKLQFRVPTVEVRMREHELTGYELRVISPDNRRVALLAQYEEANRCILLMEQLLPEAYNLSTVDIVLAGLDRLVRDANAGLRLRKIGSTALLQPGAYRKEENGRLYGSTRFPEDGIEIISSRRFEHLGTTAVEYLVRWNGDQPGRREDEWVTVMWVRDSFSTLEIEGKGNYMIHSEYSCLLGTQEGCRKNVRDLYEHHWGLKPVEDGGELLQTEQPSDASPGSESWRDRPSLL